MTWTRLDDNWTRDRVIRRLDHQTRWHYLCMIQECSGGKIYDGVLSLNDALRCSDADDPRGALDALLDAELVEVVNGGEDVRVVHIADHVPSADLLHRLANDKARAARYRKHKSGDHSGCSPERCEHAGQVLPVTASPVPTPSPSRASRDDRHDASRDEERWDEVIADEARRAADDAA